MGKEICHYYISDPADFWFHSDGNWLIIYHKGEDTIFIDSIDTYSIVCRVDKNLNPEIHECVIQINSTYLQDPEEHYFHFQPEQYREVFSIYDQLSRILQSREHRGTSESS